MAHLYKITMDISYLSSNYMSLGTLQRLCTYQYFPIEVMWIQQKNPQHRKLEHLVELDTRVGNQEVLDTTFLLLVGN